MNYRSSNKWINFSMKMTGIGIFLGVLVLVFLYNQTVGLRSEVKEVTADVESLRVENADLKNQYYSTLDSENLIAVASKLGLVKDHYPEYLNLGESDKSNDSVTLSANLGE